VYYTIYQDGLPRPFFVGQEPPAAVSAKRGLNQAATTAATAPTTPDYSGITNIESDNITMVYASVLVFYSGWLNHTVAQDCSFTRCENGTCGAVIQACPGVFFDTAVIIGATLAGGLIAAIVIGVIVAVAGAGGASYALYTNTADGTMAPVGNNPLFEAQGTGGDNPMHGQN